MITLSSDFGSPYPAAMKGVIKRRCDAELVDVAHDFPRQDVRSGAFWLKEVLPYFPPAVHLVVLDPGVGTERAALAIRAGEHALVGPDNGVLLPAARRIASKRDLTVFEIEYGETGSNTFHGRDVFAPIAAAIHEVGVHRIGVVQGASRTTTYEDLTFPTPDVTEDRARGEVLVIDGFGNVITNIPGAVLDGLYGEQVGVNAESVVVDRTYATVPRGERLVTVGSHGNVELAVNRGRGDEAFGVTPGDEVELSW